MVADPLAANASSDPTLVTIRSKTSVAVLPGRKATRATVRASKNGPKTTNPLHILQTFPPSLYHIEALSLKVTRHQSLQMNPHHRQERLRWLLIREASSMTMNSLI